MQDSMLRVAEPEKVILDYLYLKKPKMIEDIEALRFNVNSIKDIVNLKKLDNYLLLFNSKTLNERTEMFKTIIYA